MPRYGPYTANNGTNNVTTTLTATSATFFTNVGDTNGPAKVVASLSGSTFTIQVAHTNAGSCPGVSTGSACTWGTPRTLVTVNNIVNNVATNPIFTYTVDIGGTLTSYSTTGTATTVGTDLYEFASCNSTSCPANDIESVKVNLEVNAAPNKAGQAQDDTVVYELSPISQGYLPEVG